MTAIQQVLSELRMDYIDHPALAHETIIGRRKEQRKQQQTTKYGFGELRLKHLGEKYQQ